MTTHLEADKTGLDFMINFCYHRPRRHKMTLDDIFNQLVF